MLRSLLVRRRSAYRVLFAPDPRGQHDGEALAHAARLVLADLAKVGRARKPTHVPGDTHETAFREGKRAVWLHVQSFLRMTDEQVAQLTEESIE